MRLKIRRGEADHERESEPFPAPRSLSPSHVPATPTPQFSRTVLSTAPSTDPLGRIIRAYDRAIHACESFDTTAAHRRIGLLRSALALDSQSSRSFDALYAWCEEQVDGHDFIGPARTLRALRDAWCRANDGAPITPRSDLPVS